MRKRGGGGVTNFTLYFNFLIDLIILLVLQCELCKKVFDYVLITKFLLQLDWDYLVLFEIPDNLLGLSVLVHGF